MANRCANDFRGWTLQQTPAPGVKVNSRLKAFGVRMRTDEARKYWRQEAMQANKFFHLAMRRGRKIAKVAMARKLAVHLYWMWRQGRDYGQLEQLGSHAGEPGNRHGVQ